MGLHRRRTSNRVVNAYMELKFFCVSAQRHCSIERRWLDGTIENRSHKITCTKPLRRRDAASDLAWGKVKPFKNVDAARLRYLTIAEAKRLINASEPDFRLLVQAALQTEVRYSELARLTVSDFNPDVAMRVVSSYRTWMMSCGQNIGLRLLSLRSRI